MVKIAKEDIYERIRTYATTNYQKLDAKDFIIGEAPFNRKCHLNSVQKVKEGKAEKVFSCFTIDKTNNSQCIHFINQLENGKYQDNTWGWLYEQSEYYIIKEILPDEQEHIWDQLTGLKNMIVKANSTKFERFIYKIKPEDVI